LQLTIVALVMMATLAGSARVAASQPHETSSFVVVVHDYAHTSPADLNLARQNVLRIFRKAGVEPVWLDAGSDAYARAAAAYPGGPDALAVAAIVVNLEPFDKDAAEGSKMEVLGRAAVGSRFAWIFCQPVAEAAARNRDTAGDVLGNVIAHELGHLLLPSGAHAPTGIMTAVMDLGLVQQGGLYFVGRQPAQIRARLAGWNRAGQRP
jgi:hypothetical protein